MFVLTAVVPAQVPQGWTSVRSKNFNLIGDAGEAEIRTAATRLEEFRSAVGQLLPTLKLESPGVPTNVVIFRNAESYRPFKPKRADGSVDDLWRIHRSASSVCGKPSSAR